MMDDDLWLLPEGIEDILPPAAYRLEYTRRQLLDLFDRWGYDLVVPPVIDFLDGLLRGTGPDVDLLTFKVTDQASGRLLGLRADMTPQVARIDAQHRAAHVPSRLCYIGTVLHARGDGFGGSRSPIQVGAELYGHPGPASDIEIIRLMLSVLALVEAGTVHLAIGHMGVYRALVGACNLSAENERALFAAMRRKAVPDVREVLDAAGVPQALADSLLAICECTGDVSVLDALRTRLVAAPAPVKTALETLGTLVAALARSHPRVPVHLDLGDLSGYAYHSGVVFAAFVPGRGQAIAKGGRYDDVERAFGRARPATGFSSDLRALLACAAGDDVDRMGIYAPADDDEGLAAAIAALRESGERVVQGLPGSAAEAFELGCDRMLCRQADEWVVRLLASVN